MKLKMRSWFSVFNEEYVEAITYLTPSGVTGGSERVRESANDSFTMHDPTRSSNVYDHVLSEEHPFSQSLLPTRSQQFSPAAPRYHPFEPLCTLPLFPPVFTYFVQSVCSFFFPLINIPFTRSLHFSFLLSKMLR